MMKKSKNITNEMRKLNKSVSFLAETCAQTSFFSKNKQPKIISWKRRPYIVTIPCLTFRSRQLETFSWIDKSKKGSVGDRASRWFTNISLMIIINYKWKIFFSAKNLLKKTPKKGVKVIIIYRYSRTQLQTNTHTRVYLCWRSK